MEGNNNLPHLRKGVGSFPSMPMRSPSMSDLTAISPLAHLQSWGPLGTKGFNDSCAINDSEFTSAMKPLGSIGECFDIDPLAYANRSVDDELIDDELADSIREMDPFEVPLVFIEQGMLLLKVSHKSKKRIKLWVDAVNFRFFYSQVNKNNVYEFLVDDIRDVTAREKASHYREELGISKEFEKRWLSIKYYNHAKNKQKNLNLIADTNHDLKRVLAVIEGFRRFKENVLKGFSINLRDLDDVQKELLSGKAEPADKQKKEVLNFADVQKYCRRLAINLSGDRLDRLFQNVVGPGKRDINFEEFKKIVKMIKQREDLDSIWKSIVANEPYMDFPMFCRFMNQTQKESLDREVLLKIFNRFTRTESNLWNQENWASFLSSKVCSSLKQDFHSADYFNHPLNEYFILSSHNTYLTGRQIAGDSSVEGYVKALRRGCRCLEIDVWNNEEDSNGEPIVNHGRTFTNGISLSNVLQTIKKYSFYATSLPVILSFEIHCSQEGQLQIVKLLIEVFGGALILQPIDHSGMLPSPNSLRNRVIVKVKKTSTSSDLGVDEKGRFVSTSTTGTSFSESNESTMGPRRNSLKIRRKSSNKVVSALSDLGIYCQGIKFRNFSLPESKTYNHCFSLSEKSINAMLKDEGKIVSLDKHNRKYLMRVYPSKYRLKSSNFIPSNYWAHGVQMVATNWQTYDLGQQLNEALFDGVQGRGYILKPPYLRKPLMKSSMRKTLLKPIYSTRFRIEVLSAQMLPKPSGAEVMNPFVIVDIVGPSSIKWDRDSTVGPTRIVSGNGFSPVWGQAYSGSFECDNQFVFLKLSVHSSASTSVLQDSKEVGILVANLFQLQQGYRYFPLKDSCGEQLLYSSVFLKIEYVNN